MKTRKYVFLIFVVVTSVTANAQLKILSTGKTNIYNQTAIYSNTNNVSDLVDILGDNPSLSNGHDLIWGIFRQSQPNNPGLLTLMSVDGGYFTVRANGHVGIFNDNPGEAL